MHMTTRISKGEDFFVGTINEIPEVITQGISIDETRANMLDALQLYLESMQDQPMEENVVMEESIKIG